MLDRQKVIAAFEKEEDNYKGYAQKLSSQRKELRARLAKLQECDYHALMNRLAADTPQGALPTLEWDEATDLGLPFGRQWANHEEARAWALEVLTGRPVAAVDGSQIPPTKDFNIPVGAVQIGWFINPHRAGEPYVKNVSFTVLSPIDLADDAGEAVDDRPIPNWRIDLERFSRECEQLCKIMADYANAPQNAKPLCFFDGSLIISFATQLRPNRVERYTKSVLELLKCSEENKVPLVAFVDRSVSRDFVTLVDKVTSGGAIKLSDAGVLNEQLQNWGDRSPLFYCDRDDTYNRSRKNHPSFYNKVAFTYMRLTRDRVPARIEMPHWIVEEGLANDVLDLVRAECVVGGGYPYAVETADALAVISHADRERFYSLFEQFAQKSGLELVQARKASSKNARR